jgi:hypothetical protein
MNPPPQALWPRIQRTLAEARFLTFSALLHLGIVFGIGTLILFHKLAPEIFETHTEVSLITDAPITEDDPPGEVTLSDSVTPLLPNTSVQQEIIVTSVQTSLRFTSGNGVSNRLSNELSNVNVARIGTGTGPSGNHGVFGSHKRFGLVGTFYDLKQTRSQTPTGVTPDDYQKIFRRFVREDWRESILETYFKAPTQLFTTQIFIPNMAAAEGPKAFGVEKTVQPSRWLALYKGRVSPPSDGVYHFVGGGDDVLVVRFNRKVVLDRCWRQEGSEWQPTANYHYGFTGIPNGFAKGDPLRLQANETYDIEVLIGEQPGMFFYSCLMFEKEGETYAKDSKGNPILPVFRVSDDPVAELREGETLPPYQADGPVWQCAAASQNSAIY